MLSKSHQHKKTRSSKTKYRQIAVPYLVPQPLPHEHEATLGHEVGAHDAHRRRQAPREHQPGHLQRQASTETIRQTKKKTHTYIHTLNSFFWVSLPWPKRVMNAVNNRIYLIRVDRLRKPGRTPSQTRNNTVYPRRYPPPPLTPPAPPDPSSVYPSYTAYQRDDAGGKAPRQGLHERSCRRFPVHQLGSGLPI